MANEHDADAILSELRDLSRKFDVYMKGQEACRERCTKAYEAIHGNGSPGMKTRLAVIEYTLWGTGGAVGCGGLVGIVWWLVSTVRGG